MRNKCEQAGISVKSIHALRRTLNSKMKCRGVSSTVAASLLGHTEEVFDYLIANTCANPCKIGISESCVWVQVPPSAVKGAKPDFGFAPFCTI